MKKAVTILLLVVFLFNLVGYKALFFYLQLKADAQLEAEIEKISDTDSRLITIRIPINLPYTPEEKQFKDASGEVDFKGITYKYVKSRIERGELILLCIKHTEKANISSNSDQFSKRFSSLLAENSKKSSFKVSKADFFEKLHQYFPSQHSISKQTSEQFASIPSATAGYPSKLEMPPRDLG